LLQLRCVTEPSGQNLPWLHVRQDVLPSWSANAPSGQGSGAAAPSSQYEPAGQSWHAVWPVSFWKVPAAQSGQMSRPVALLAVPRRHSWHASELLAPLMGWNVPTPHELHPALVLRPVVFDHVPGSHCWKTDALLAPDSAQ